MSELRASVVMDLRGNLDRQARRYEGAMRGMATNGQRHMGRLQRVAGGLGNTLDRVGNRWVALATGAAGVGTVRSLVALEERFTRLGIQSGRSAEEMEELRRQIFETARAPDIRVDPAQITAAIEGIVEKTGDLEFARENLRNIAAAISATGAEGTNIGQIMAEFQKMDLRDMDAVLGSIDTLNQQGKQGAFTLQNLAKLGPRVVTAYTAMGRTGPDAIREMGAALQVISRASGGPEETATRFENLLRTFQNADTIRELQRGGIQVMDPEDPKRMRAITDIMVELVERVDGSAQRLSEVITNETALSAFNSLFSEFNANGEITSFEQFLRVQGDGAATMADSARAAETARGALQNLSTTWQKFADDNLSQHIQSAADALNSLDQEAVDRWLKIGGAVAGLTAAAYAGRSLYKLGGFYGRLGRGVQGGSTTGGIAGSLGGAAGSMAPVPVYVTNWGARGPGGRNTGTRKGGGYSPPTNRPTPKSSPSASTGSKVSPSALRAASALGSRAIPAAGVGMTALSLGALLENAVESTKVGRSIGGYAELAREIAKEVVLEYGRSQVETFREALRDRSESVLKISVDQDGVVRRVEAERDSDGPQVDVDLGDWRTMP
ncbi:hypothetical protein [Halomonas sp.]|uniref:hypothetical protein n=1 Tax=Halomonas sp. TaxID=1486246 RepID=UPI00298E2655|nr:hypothetical protein [Halomonas sp.]MDW7745875.1 hypothetical protein [Halomonas sp.]